MEHEEAETRPDEAAPIFTAYRRGYDPDQVDRYVTEQRRRLDEALHRASEAERKLAAAVGQLRELHRRVAVLENEERAQPPAIDSIGERIQRILQEAWDGALAMRQTAESDATALREQARFDADAIIETAKQKAVHIDEELERRRQSYMARLEEERSRAVSQMTFLQRQRKLALEELMRVRTLIDTRVEEFADRPRPAATPPSADPSPDAPIATGVRLAEDRPSDRPPERRTSSGDALPPTMPVHRLATAASELDRDPSELVRAQRALQPEDQPAATVHDLSERRERPVVFDFEADASEDE